jgi:hypothetical protein
MNEPTPVRAGDALEWLHEQGKRRAGTAPEFDVEETLRKVRAVQDADAHALAAGRLAASSPQPLFRPPTRDDTVSRTSLRGHDFEPNPLAATTAAEFMAVLRDYRVWSGDPSWREMARRTGGVSHSTLYNAMNRDTLPSLRLVRAIVVGCGGNDNDLQEFSAAWQRIQENREGGFRLVRHAGEHIGQTP